MSEAYFISGCQLPAGSSLDDILNTVFSSAGCQTPKIDEIHLFSDAATALFQRRIDTVFGPVIQWPLIPSLPVSALFSACRALETGELSTCVLVENSAQSANAILLANPNAVGRYNLSPQAHFSIRSSHPAGIIDLPGSAAKLIAAIPVDEPEPEDETPDLRVPPKKPARPWLAVRAPERTVVPGLAGRSVDFQGIHFSRSDETG